MQRKYRTASLNAGQVGPVSISTVTGIVSLAIAREAGEDMDRSARDVGAMARIIRLDGAVIGLSLDQLVDAAISARHPTEPLPTAIVAADGQRQMMREYAWTMNQYGFTRAVFAAMAPALQWALDQAAVETSFSSASQGLGRPTEASNKCAVEPPAAAHQALRRVHRCRSV